MISCAFDEIENPIIAIAVKKSFFIIVNLRLFLKSKIGTITLKKRLKLKTFDLFKPTILK
ncbi:hypothetical protein GCM10007384_02800 [Aquimarina muelleri]|uniref:Uncharacterized protein n=1 Tax=Aquimarina muelleri TaxID=279356 RepID=A0A918JSK3_9FLAO|nr:hypothetical protein GCM10007384_02800 [Aquimarina muelleri]